MAIEIERKFLMKSDAWRAHAADGVLIRQGYVMLGDPVTLRIRIAGDRAFLTLKGKTTGASRSEFEYEIPVEDAEGMMAEYSVGRPIEKVRHKIPHAGRVWEIDEFRGAHDGLVLAEIELDGEEDVVVLPDWIGEEVTLDPRYRNSEMVAAALASSGGPVR